MSNFLAIATVTETLRYVLNSYVSADVNSATATAVSPSGANNSGSGAGLPTTGVNVFCYQVMPNAACRNLDLPTRASDGSPVQPPRAAIDLHYMFSAYGSYLNREPERVLGSVIRTLNSYPFLSREFIEEAVAALGKVNAHDLDTQDLSTDLELVKLAPLALTLDELSRVWSVYFQTSYAISVCYQASVVYLQDAVAPSTVSYPVRRRNVLSSPISPPSIDTISPQPATVGAVITLTGANVGVGSPLVRFGSAPPVPATSVSANQITVPLPAGLNAGVVQVSVYQNITFGPPSAQLIRPGVESAPVLMSLAPTITQPLSVTTLTPPASSTAAPVPFLVNFDTPIGPLQSVALILGSYAIQLPGRSVVSAAASATSFTFNVPFGVPTGPAVPVRLQVDGVQSALAFNAATSTYTPSVNIP